MGLEVILIIAVVALLSFILGAGIIRYFFPVEVMVLTSRTDAPRLTPGTRHKHEYDHVRDDGKGWRCGLCDKPKLKEDAA